MSRNNSHDTIEKNKLIEGNIRLVEKVQELERDIVILIGYIKGNKELEEQANEITEYYSNLKIKG